MKEKVIEVIENSFYQLLLVYAALIAVISVGFISKYSIYFNILAVVIALFGISLLFKEFKISEKINKNLHLALFILGSFLIFYFRIIPYLNNIIPLGYDAGIYKYVIGSSLNNLDLWIFQSMEPGFIYLMKFIKLFFSSDFILIHIFIFFNFILGISIYFFTKEYFGNRTAIISFLIYSVSLIQFKVFTFLYYKNIIALSLMLFSFYFLKKSEKSKSLVFRFFFILFSAGVGIMHRPTFYILGLSYFVYSFTSPFKESYDITVFKKKQEQVLRFRS
jgi:hypothetical protein